MTAAQLVAVGAMFATAVIGVPCLLITAYVIRPRPAPVLRVDGPARPVHGCLAPFPGDGIVTAAELDRFARTYQGMQR